MNVRRRIGCALLLGCLAPAVARADHHEMAMPSDDGSLSYDVSVSVVAASFSPSGAADMPYGGDYQGVATSASVSVDRYAAGASWAYYRLLRNGLEQYGVGDLVAHGQVMLYRDDELQAGLIAAVSAPTGDEITGFGMGHTMLMPAAWGTWHRDRLILTGSAGYSRALSMGGHVHGMAPIVDPMNMSEITWSGSGDVAIGDGVRAGVRLTGGIPVAVTMGTDRVVGAIRVAWGEGRVNTAAELQAGLAGDPFNIRGVVQTSLRF